MAVIITRHAECPPPRIPNQSNSTIGTKPTNM
jgi:hypothetical protein